MRILFGAILFLVGTFVIWPAIALNAGQWEASDLAIRKWFQGLMQPDNPTVPCCGEADAYWADAFEIQGDQYVAIITDERPDGPLGRQHIAPGTKIVIPNSKLKYDAGNPTGHGVVFVRPYSDGASVYCYIAPGGV